MKAVILAGGKGRRLQPYTSIIPKPLAPVGHLPILEIVIRQLINAGLTEVTLTLGYLGELIRAFFATRTALTEAIDLRFVQEEEPTGTAGSLTMVPDLDETFLVMNGDILTTLDFDALLRFHRQSGATLTIAGYRKNVQIDLGVLALDDDGMVQDYIEKPKYVYPVSMGIYVYEPRALDFIPQGQYFDFPSLVLELIKANEPVACFENDCRWLDIGRPEDFAEAQRVFETHRDEFHLAD